MSENYVKILFVERTFAAEVTELFCIAMLIRHDAVDFVEKLTVFRNDGDL